MPTGYTAKIGEGGTFEEFAWGCARAFGARAMMRDEPHDAPVPQEFEPSPYYLKRIEETRAELDRLEAMTDDEAAMEAAEARRKVGADNAERKAKAEALSEKYAAMLARVHAWVPPSEDHVGMKEFMIEQIETSLKHDCDPWEYPLPTRDGAAWRAMRASQLKEDLAHARRHWKEEQERTAGRNRWVRQLRESIPQPTRTRKAAEEPTP